MGSAMVSGSHCQGGDAAYVSTLIKAYSTDFCTISDNNMLQETAVETSSNPPPPPPATTTSFVPTSPTSPPPPTSPTGQLPPATQNSELEERRLRMMRLSNFQPMSTQESDQEIGFGGKKRTKKSSKRKTRKTKKRKTRKK